MLPDFDPDTFPAPITRLSSVTVNMESPDALEGLSSEGRDEAIFARTLTGDVWTPLAGDLHAHDLAGYVTEAGTLLGAKRPTLDFDQRNLNDPRDPISMAYKTWWEEAKRLVKEAGCEFVVFGDDEDDQFVAVAISDSVLVTQDAAYGMGLMPTNAAGPIWKAKLGEFCARTGIAWRKPEWHVVMHACA